MDQIINEQAPGWRAEEDRKGPITKETLRDWMRILQKYKTGKARLERRVQNAENWWKLRNEMEEAKVSELDPAEFNAKSGWLHNVIASKHADAMEAYPEPNILPREKGDQQEARMLSAVIPCILEQNRFEHTYDRAMWQKLKTGTGVYMITWDKSKLNGLGDISIQTVNLLNLFWEPGVADIQDSRHLFYTYLEDGDTLIEQYPQLRGRLKPDAFQATKFLYDDQVPTDNQFTVINHYYHRFEGGRRVLHYCQFVGDVVLYATEQTGQDTRMPGAVPGGRAAGGVGPYGEGPGMGAAGLGDTGGGPSRTPAPTGAVPGMGGIPGAAGLREPEGGPPRTPAPAGAVPGMGAGPGVGAPGMPGAVPALPNSGFRATNSSRGLYEHGKYPFVFDVLFPVEGSPCGYGFVDLAANEQTQVDLMKTAFIKNTMAGATPRYFARSDGAVNEEEFLDLHKALVHVSGNLGEDSLRRVEVNSLHGNYINVLEQTISELRETTGNTETANGISTSGATAASAIAALQEASGKGSRDSAKASYRAFAELVDQVIELVRQFYDMPRTFRITGRDGSDEFTRYSNQGLQPQWQGMMGSVDMGFRLPVFDIKIEPQKRNPYTKLAQNELAMQLYGAGFFSPQNGDMAMAVLDMMEFEGKDKVAQRIAMNADMYQKLVQFQQMALTLAQQYRPDLVPGLAQAITGGAAMAGGAFPSSGQAAMPTQEAAATGNAGEATHVRKARERAARASQPD